MTGLGRVRPGNHGTFEAETGRYPQGHGHDSQRGAFKPIFSHFRDSPLLTLVRARAYIRAIDGGCFATSSCSFLLIMDVGRAFRGQELRRLLDIAMSRLFDIIGRKRSADGGFFAVCWPYGLQTKG